MGRGNVLTFLGPSHVGDELVFGLVQHSVLEVVEELVRWVDFQVEYDQYPVALGVNEVLPTRTSLHDHNVVFGLLLTFLLQNFLEEAQFVFLFIGLVADFVLLLVEVDFGDYLHVGEVELLPLIGLHMELLIEVLVVDFQVKLLLLKLHWVEGLFLLVAFVLVLLGDSRGLFGIGRVVLLLEGRARRQLLFLRQDYPQKVQLRLV